MEDGGESRRGVVRFGLNMLVYAASFSPKDLDLIGKVADMGYDGVEIPFADLEVLDAKAIGQACRRAGMGLTACCVLAPDGGIASLDADQRRSGRSRLRRMIDLAAQMGCEVVGGPLYAPVRCLTGRACTGEEWKWCVEGLRQAGEHAAGSDLLLAIEPLNRFETHVVNTVSDAVALAREVGCANLKVQVDTFHANIEEKHTASAIRAAGDMVGHFHASESDRGVPGTGQVRWKEAFAALAEIGYGGWVTIESFATGIVDLCAAACIWRPIYESADDLARRGLAFLKETALASGVPIRAEQDG